MYFTFFCFFRERSAVMLYTSFLDYKFTIFCSSKHFKALFGLQHKNTHYIFTSFSLGFSNFYPIQAFFSLHLCCIRAQLAEFLSLLSLSLSLRLGFLLLWKHCRGSNSGLRRRKRAFSSKYWATNLQILTWMLLCVFCIEYSNRNITNGFPNRGS